MELPITVTKEQKFMWIVEILGSTIQPFKSLRPKEREVLAQLYYYNTIHQNVPEEYRSKVTFSKETKQLICDRLGITVDNLYNIMVVLRKKNLLTKEPEGFNKKVLITDTNTLTFNFNET